MCIYFFSILLFCTEARNQFLISLFMTEFQIVQLHAILFGYWSILDIKHQKDNWWLFCIISKLLNKFGQSRRSLIDIHGEQL